MLHRLEKERKDMDGYATRKQHLRGKDTEKKPEITKTSFMHNQEKKILLKKGTNKGFHTKTLPLVSNYSILDTTLMDNSCSNIH